MPSTITSASPFHVPAPWAWFHPRSKSTLAARLGAVAEYWLSKQQIPALPTRPHTPLHYVSMAGRKHWLLLRESLVSLCSSWTHIPRLSVISDGTWEEDEFREYFYWWPTTLTVWSPQQVLDLLPTVIASELRILAQAHPLGIKLAGIVALSTQNPLLFIDSDVLWFSDPWAGQIERSLDFSIAAGVDPACSYNPAVGEMLGPSFLAPPFTNSGCVWLQIEKIDMDFLKRVLAVVQATPSHEFNEQTVIAALTYKQGVNLPIDFFLVKFDDERSVSPKIMLKNPPNSRHYVRFIRHLFYRDALLQRVRNSLRASLF